MAYTTIDNPELHFQAKVYTADSSANRLITLDGSENMQPDWVWMKNRDQSVNHDLYDSVRGTTKYISSNKINAEATNADGLVGFNTDGFTVDTSWGNISTGNSYIACVASKFRVAFYWFKSIKNKIFTSLINFSTSTRCKN